MFNWLKTPPTNESRPSARKTLRTITSDRGTRFDVFAETAHYVMCHEPDGNKDTPSQAILDFEDMARKGYWLCHVYPGLGAFIVFEKREPQN